MSLKKIILLINLVGLVVLAGIIFLRSRNLYISVR